MLWTSRSVILAPLAAAALALGACGGGGSDDVNQVLDKGFSTPIRSADVNLDVSVELNGVKDLKGPVKLTVQGPYQSGENETIPKADWDIAASAAGQNFSAGFVSTGDNAWVAFQGQSYEVGKAAVAQVNQQIKQAAGQQDKQGLAQFGIDPRNWLVDAKDEGDQKVAGVDTQHVSASLDVGKFLDDVNRLVQKAGGNLGGGAAAPQLTEDEKRRIEEVVENPRFDVYVGKDDDVIRRLSADIAFKVPKDQQAQLNGLTSGTLSFSIEFANVGQAQKIEPPSNAKPLSELTGQLGGLGGALGGAGAGGAASGSGSSGAGAANADALQEYSKCLQDADPSKPAELDKCAELLK